MLRAIDCGPDAAELLDVIDRLRADVIAGRVVAFAGVTIAPDDGTSAYCGTTRHVTRLRTQGAIAQLLHEFLAGNV